MTIRRRIQIAACAIFLLPALAVADEWEAALPVGVAARALQAKLPAVAVDGLFEARHRENCWEYRFLTAIHKNWTDDVTVTVCMKAALSSTVKVEAAHVEGGFVKTRRSVQPEKSAEWSGRIRQLLEE